MTILDPVRVENDVKEKPGTISEDAVMVDAVNAVANKVDPVIVENVRDDVFSVEFTWSELVVAVAP